MPFETMQYENKRFFSGWASVDVVDKTGERIPIEEFENVLPLMMSRGIPLSLNHTNHSVGRIINAEIKEKRPGVKGVHITGEIHNDYESDRVVWEAIKSGKLKYLSFGGAMTKTAQADPENNNAMILRGIEGWEVAICENPANQESVMTAVSVAKSEEVQKPFTDYASFSDCVSQNKGKENPEAFCAWLEHRATGKWPAEKEINDRGEDMKKEMPAPGEAQMPATDLEARLSALEEAVANIAASMGNMQKQFEEKKPEEKKPEEKEKADGGQEGSQKEPEKQPANENKPKVETGAPNPEALGKQVEEAVKKALEARLPKSETERPIQKKEEKAAGLGYSALDIARGKVQKSFGELSREIREKETKAIKELIA